MIFNKLKIQNSLTIFSTMYIFCSESKIFLTGSCIGRLCYVTFGNAIGHGHHEGWFGKFEHSVGDGPSRGRKSLRDDLKRSYTIYVSDCNLLPGLNNVCGSLVGGESLFVT